MFRLSVRRLAVSAYSLFMRDQKYNPQLQGLPVPKRGKLLGKLYRQLKPQEMALLQKRASKVSYKRRKSVKVKPLDAIKPKKRAVGRSEKYSDFVKKNIKKFKHLPHQKRVKAVAKLSKSKKK